MFSVILKLKIKTFNVWFDFLILLVPDVAKGIQG